MGLQHKQVYGSKVVLCSLEAQLPRLDPPSTCFHLKLWGGERGAAGAGGLGAPGTRGFMKAALQVFTLSSRLDQEALRSCSGGAGVCVSLRSGGTHKYWSLSARRSLSAVPSVSERLQEEKNHAACEAARLQLWVPLTKYLTFMYKYGNYSTDYYNFYLKMIFICKF